jgi:hypothetical protein
VARGQRCCQAGPAALDDQSHEKTAVRASIARPLQVPKSREACRQQPASVTSATTRRDTIELQPPVQATIIVVGVLTVGPAAARPATW